MTINSHLKFHAKISKWSTLALVFLRCTQQSVHGGGEEREPCANSLSSLSSAPNDSWQTTNANPIWAATVAPPPASLALPIQENPAPATPPTLLHTQRMIHAQKFLLSDGLLTASALLLNQDNTLLFSHMTAESNGSSRAGGDCGIHMQPNTCSFAAATLSATY